MRRGLGRSRGGLSTKLHAAVNAHGQLLRLLVTPGQRGDAPQAELLLQGVRMKHMLADTIREEGRELRHLRLARRRSDHAR